MNFKVVGIGAALAIALFLGLVQALFPGSREPFPYAERVPADAAIYVAVPNLPEFLDELDQHPEWKATLGLEQQLSRVKRIRAFMAGPAAFFAVMVEGKLKWTSYIRLLDGRTHVEGTEYRGSKSMKSVLNKIENRNGRPQLILNFDHVPEMARGFLGEFSRAILEIRISDELSLDGKVTYRPGMYGEIVQYRLHETPPAQPGRAPFAHSGLTDVRTLFQALNMNPPIPDHLFESLGPSWGVEVRSSGDIAFWFEARAEARVLDGHEWNGFISEVRGDKWILRTRGPVQPMGAGKAHAVTRIQTAAAIAALRVRSGRKAEPIFRMIERVSNIESRLSYRSDWAELRLKLTHE